ncbi:MAG: NAD(P)H-dependent oxidoreductase [Bowdeniella nasicola]|nr:NAD(P)H-dependent oxidoreductase [Bowdeniella nasicola]
MIRLAVIDASTSPARTGGPISDWIAACAKRMLAFEVEVIRLREVKLPLFDEPYLPRYHHYAHDHTRAWSERVAAFDAFIFVSPEYNRGYSALLKNALDHLAQEWAFKPAGIVAYGASMSGGLRGAAALADVLTSLQMYVTREQVYVPFAGKEAHRWQGREVAWGSEGDGSFLATPGMVEAAEAMLDAIVRLDAAMMLVRTPSQTVGDQQGIGNPPAAAISAVGPRPVRNDREEWRRSGGLPRR